MMNQQRRGFTLVEMLIVIAIIAVISGITYPLARSAIAKSREASCLNNLRSLGTGLQSYLQDHNNIMPTMKVGRASKTEDVPVLDTVLLPYMGSAGAFECPADHEQFDKTGSSYLWNSLENELHVSNLSFFRLQDILDQIPLITDKESWHPGGVNYLYADSSVSNKPRFAVANRN